MKFRAIYLLIVLLPIEFIGMYIDYTFRSLLGYIPYVFISIVVSLILFKYKFKSSYLILVTRVIGILLSLMCAHLFMDIYN
ncbi:hypothetical protein CD132_06455, partial [Staphylococcus microti]